VVPGGTQRSLSAHVPSARRGATARADAWLLSRSQRSRRLGLILYWTLIYFMTHWPRVEDFPGIHWLPEWFDSVVHFCFYTGWAAMWWWVLAGWRGSISVRAAGWLVLGGAVYAVFDELTQAIVGRDPEMSDFLCDTAGVMVTLLVLSGYSRWRSRFWTGAG